MDYKVPNRLESENDPTNSLESPVVELTNSEVELNVQVIDELPIRDLQME
jgi:hypothetical protein